MSSTTSANSLLLSYSSEHWLPRRFFSLTLEGMRTTPTVLGHQPNIKTLSGLCEWTGNKILSIPENMPTWIKNVCTNPQVVAVTTFIVAEIALSYGFYPDTTILILTTLQAYTPAISLEAVRFCTWLSASTSFLGALGRVSGRLTDDYLKKLEAIYTARRSEGNNR